MFPLVLNVLYRLMWRRASARTYAQLRVYELAGIGNNHSNQA
jgi:hypothetical protein